MEVCYISEDQYKILLSKIPTIEFRKFTSDVVELLIRLIYEGALRVSEAIHIYPTDLDIQKKLIILRATKGGWRKCKCANKTDMKGCKVCNGTGKKRVNQHAWVSDELFDKLYEYAKTKPQSYPLFPIGRQGVFKIMRRLGRECDITMHHEGKDSNNLFVHALRHSRAVHMLGHGCNINAVQVKLRHKSIAQTGIYTRISNEDCRKMEFSH